MENPILRTCLFLIGLLLVFQSCKDQCKSTYTYKNRTPVFATIAELRASVEVLPPQEMKQAGKIYYREPYVFVNEPQKGIHIYNNQNPQNPQFISFIKIPGNVDMAVKDHILYADSYVDLLAFDISNPLQSRLIKRLENVFQHNYYFTADRQSIMTGFEEEWVTVENPDDCIHPRNSLGRPIWEGDVFTASGNRLQTATLSASTPAGIGGSMARFTILNDRLYTVSDFELQVFQIQKAEDPVKGAKMNIGWGIETIFPYHDNLFIGSQTGMFIYNTSNPDQPKFLSGFTHARACDPVVAEGDYAYVTLRSNNTCLGFANQLDVVNIKNLTAPFLVKSYPMQNPHGLGISNSTLFICEGEYGLKVFDAKNVQTIDKNLLQHLKNIKSTDVIPLGKVLLVIGDDGLYQFDYSQPNNLKLLSKIEIKKQ